jgi:hypothetical protein
VEQYHEISVSSLQAMKAAEAFEKKVINTISEIGKIHKEGERIAYSVIRGHFKGWSFEKTTSYYSLPRDIAATIWGQFGFKKILKGGEQVTTNTKSKQSDIMDYVKKNVGQVVTATQVSADVNISLPTFYNFVKANNQMFEKVRRGQFKIVSV